MPAVELTRLHTQIRLIRQYYADPDEFVKHLNDIYEFYSDRTFDLAKVSHPDQVSNSFNVTPLINRQFEMEFGKLCQENPLSSLGVIDKLWTQRKVEPRQLAAALLGKMPVEYSNQVIERLKAWATPEEDYELVKYLQEHGTIQLRSQSLDEWLDVIRKWLQSDEVQDQIFGLQSLLPIIRDLDFIDLPQVFDLVLVVLPYPKTRVLYTLQTVIEALAKRTPVETVYLLKSVLKGQYSNEVPRFFRRLVQVFPEEQAESLQQAVKGL